MIILKRAARTALSLLLAAVLAATLSATITTPAIAASGAFAHGAEAITLPIDSPAEAHQAVLASGAPFDGFVELTSDLIGASMYYEVKGEVGSDAAWIVVYTYGWGDCQAGCIDGHTFVYQVDPVTGAATFDSSAGAPLPTTASEELLALSGRTQEPTASPDWGALYDQWYQDFVASLAPCAPGVDPADPAVQTCRQPDGSVVGPIPLWAPAPRPGPWPVDGGDAESDNGWVHELPQIIFAVLLALSGGAAFVGWRKSRAND